MKNIWVYTFFFKKNPLSLWIRYRWVTKQEDEYPHHANTIKSNARKYTNFWRENTVRTEEEFIIRDNNNEHTYIHTYTHTHTHTHIYNEFKNT